ncbi:unnamed protein product [Cylindrotheca closterium]|uniref:Cellulase n=1 Tax=Cylindrotheca closterium TaxID=2856 RepID=A0AAD2G9B0_9STRA|nr:unnamed protein product [Cylindrotheca closterium]
MFVKIVLSCAFFQAVARANYCNHDGCSGVPMGCCDDDALQYCNANSGQCSGPCAGQWCDGSFSYCTWSTCDGVIRSTEWCNAGQANCEGSCGGMWCTNGGSVSTGPTTPGTTPAPAPLPVPTTAPINPSSGSATTTRYWDCSGGACGCAYLPFGPGTDSQPSHCHSNAMFAAPAGNHHDATFYGTAAVSQELFGYNTQWLGPGCGTCYKLTGTSNIPGTPTTTTTIVLKAVNLCPPENPACSGDKVHFDIAAPGFDVTQFSFAHVCPSRESADDAGFSACEFWMLNSQDPTQNCDCSAFDSPVLEAGCNNFLSLNWDNPTVQYEPVECPFELKRLSCWEENGNQYPFGIPEFCESNVDDSPEAPVSAPVEAPVSAPTEAPVSVPVEAPVSAPTEAPVPAPTEAPVPTGTPTQAPVPSPTNAPIGGGGSFCCSSNYKDCNVGGWCGENQSRCEGSCKDMWILQQGHCSSDGIAKYGECTTNVNGCCAPGICKGNQYYRQCL